MSMQERPARPVRGKLTPPTNADLDPIDARPASTAPRSTRPASTNASTPAEAKGASAPAAAHSRAERPTASSPASLPALNVTVQSGVNWSPETEQLVRDTKARTGKTRRAIVEEAIAALWGR